MYETDLITTDDCSYHWLSCSQGNDHLSVRPTNRITNTGARAWKEL